MIRRGGSPQRKRPILIRASLRRLLRVLLFGCGFAGRFGGGDFFGGLASVGEGVVLEDDVFQFAGADGEEFVGARKGAGVSKNCFGATIQTDNGSCR